MKQAVYMSLLVLCLSAVSYGRHHHRISQEQVQTQEQPQSQEQKVAQGPLLPMEGEEIGAVAAQAWSASRGARQTLGIAWKNAQLLRENTWEGRQARRQRAEEQRHEMRAGLAEAEQRLEYVKARQSEFHRQASELLATHPNAAEVAYQHAINMDRQRYFAEQEVAVLTARVRADGQARWRDQQEELKDRQLFGIPPGIKSDRLQNPGIANSQNNRAATPGRQSDPNDRSDRFDIHIDPTPEALKHRDLTAPQWDSRFLNSDAYGPAGTFKKESNNKDYVNQTFTPRDNAGQPSNKSGGADSPSSKSRSEEERERRERRRDEK